jgi:hypothetical protein
VGQVTTYFDLDLEQFAIAMFALTATTMQGLHEAQVIADILQKLFTIAAIIVGGIWTYFNFFKGRTYRMRLEPEISGKINTLNGQHHLAATMHLKNVGLSKVEIEQKGSALQVLFYEVPLGATEVLSAAWHDLTAFPVFESHEWIEPGEMIEEQRLIVIPGDERTAFQLQLRIVSKGITWRAMDTVMPSEDNDVGKEGGDHGWSRSGGP